MLTILAYKNFLSSYMCIGIVDILCTSGNKHLCIYKRCLNILLNEHFNEHFMLNIMASACWLYTIDKTLLDNSQFSENTVLLSISVNMVW